MFRSARAVSVQPTWHTHKLPQPYFCNVYSTETQYVKKDFKPDVYSTDDSDGAPTSFFSFVHIFSDKTDQTSRRASFIAYHVYAVPVRCSGTYRRWTIKNRLFLKGVLSTQLEAAVEYRAV